LVLLTNAIILHIYTDDYGDAFGPEVLEAGFAGAASLGAGAIIGGIIINLVSVAGILLALGVFVFREFFHATFILLPVLGAMLYLDFGPLRHSSAIAKTLLRATAYMLLAGIVMAGLLQTGAAAAVGAYSDVAVQGEEMTEAEFGELIEAMLFWLIGLLAPALVGLKAAAMAGMSPRGLGRRSAKNSLSSQKQPSSSTQSGGSRDALH